MEKQTNTSKGFLHVIKATLLSLFVLSIPCIMLAMVNVSYFGPMLPLVIIFLFFYTIASLLFAGILYFLNKNASMLLYFIFFFYCLWTLIFYLSNYVKPKDVNKLYDDMDGVSESITSILIVIIYISFLCNFIVFFKSWYSGRKDSISEDDLEIE